MPKSLHVIYTRISTDEEKQPASKAAQIQAVMDHLTRTFRPGQIRIQIVSDSATGSNTDRPGIIELLQKSPPASTVWVATPDRLSRNVEDLLFLDRQLSVSYLAPLLPFHLGGRSAQDRFMLVNLANFAEYEVHVIAERTKAGMAAKAAAGKHMGRPRKISLQQLRNVHFARLSGAVWKDLVPLYPDIRPSSLRSAYSRYRRALVSS